MFEKRTKIPSQEQGLLLNRKPKHQKSSEAHSQCSKRESIVAWMNRIVFFILRVMCECVYKIWAINRYWRMRWNSISLFKIRSPCVCVFTLYIWIYYYRMSDCVIRSKMNDQTERAWQHCCRVSYRHAEWMNTANMIRFLLFLRTEPALMRARVELTQHTYMHHVQFIFLSRRYLIKCMKWDFIFFTQIAMNCYCFDGV